MTDEYVIGQASDLSEGDRLAVEIEGREIVILNHKHDYYAFTNYCPHQSAPVCEGEICSTVNAKYNRDLLQTELEYKEDQVLVCPWHGWEFDIQSGEAEHDHRMKLIEHSLRVENDHIILSL